MIRYIISMGLIILALSAIMGIFVSTVNISSEGITDDTIGIFVTTCVIEAIAMTVCLFIKEIIIYFKNKPSR